MSGEECTSGWLGTTNDWAEYAHGEFSSLEEARQAVASVGGQAGYREASPEDSPLSDLYDNIVEEYRVGSLPYLTSAENKELAFDGAQEEVNATMNDRDLDRLAEQLSQDIKSNAQALPNFLAVRELVEEVRNEKFETS
jgi:hypothetical protein